MCFLFSRCNSILLLCYYMHVYGLRVQSVIVVNRMQWKGETSAEKIESALQLCDDSVENAPW